MNEQSNGELYRRPLTIKIPNYTRFSVKGISEGKTNTSTVVKAAVKIHCIKKAYLPPDYHRHQLDTSTLKRFFKQQKKERKHHTIYSPSVPQCAPVANSSITTKREQPVTASIIS
ncbi:hypothetical protein AVEN_241202-1 [Araneus ventricosus]|uniref:Uncharacterized protein n=1 Tax=Araneus ventricosus TaxID=182803 RepID=A0A4Y2D1L5_ARAVE|nr:hypothetical protein AVEN_241202-1 [Araneus ventricosus]